MTKEQIMLRIIRAIFIVRYWVVFILFIATCGLSYYVYKFNGTEIRDTIAVFTGGIVVITVLYHGINYEYNLRKFQHEIKTSRDTLSFKTAMEWQKEHMLKNCRILEDFYELHHKLIDDGKIGEFSEKLKGDRDATMALLVVFNFLESLCLGVKQEIMDEDFIRGFFGSVFSVYYNKYLPYIEFRRRKKGNNKIWCNFTTLSSKWIQSQTK